MGSTQPPTARLPPIANISATATATLFDALQYLRALYLYHLQVRGLRRRRRALSDDVDGDHSDDGVQRLQSDAFERAYAIRWLTALIAQLEARQEQSPLPLTPPAANLSLSNTPPSDLPPIHDNDDTDALVQQAASLLALCAGVAAAGIVQRRYTFQSPLLALALGGHECSSQTQIQVLLTDIPMDNHDYASVGAQTWGGACVLAEMLVERPDQFGLLASSGFHARSDGSSHLCDGPPPPGPPSPISCARDRPLRILELGAGTGLVGLTVATLLQALSPRKKFHPSPSQYPDPNPTLEHPRATVVLTDFYPAVLANLQSNIDANFPPVADGDGAILVHTHPLDWSSFPTTTTTTETVSDVLATPFDVIFGADVVYEPLHAVWIHQCLQSLLAHPHPDGSKEDEDPAFHLVIPLRPTHAFETSTVEAVFGAKEPDRGSDEPELIILSKESIVCDAYGDGRQRMEDDVEYMYYRIGWSR